MMNFNFFTLVVYHDIETIMYNKINLYHTNTCTMIIYNQINFTILGCLKILQLICDEKEDRVIWEFEIDMKL